MKKYLLLAVAACLGLASCEDVPAPYEIFDQGGNGGGNGGGNTLSSLPYTSSNLNNDWTVATPKGTAWSLGNTYAKATGYNGGETTPSESWLISPVLNLTTDAGAAHITLEHVIRYVNASTAPLSNHTMWITTDYTGDVATTDWTKLDYHPVESATQSWDFYPADEVAIPSEFVGKNVYVAFKFVCGSSSTTWELKNFNVLAGEAAAGNNPSVPDEPDQPAGDPKGTGTQADPFNVAGIIGYTSALAADQNSDNEVYFQGVVSTVKDISPVGNYNNATFYISDDGSKSNEFYVFRCLGVNKGDIPSADFVKEGDVVVICGKVVNYKGNTPETVQKEAYIVSINGESTTPDTPGTDPDQPGEAAQQITIGEFLQKADTETTYRLVGTVQNIANTTYGNFDLVDATGTIYIYGLLNAKGETKKFEEMGIKEGDELTLEGKYVDYNGKAEIKNAQYISHKSNGGGDNPGTDPNPGDDPEPVDPSSLIQNGNFEAWTNGTPDHWKTASSAGNATLEQSSDAHGGNYSVKVKSGGSSNKRLGYEETYYAAGTYTVTFYAKSLGGATGEYGPQCRPGYATFNADGTINSSGYKYGDYATLAEGEWTKVTYEFTLDADQQICPVIMNPKNCGDFLIDDYSITKQ